LADFVRFTTSSGGDPEHELLQLFRQSMPTSADMIRAADGQIARIKTRTAEGRDVNGVPFEPYTPQYSKTRTKRGLSVTPVDLRSSGRMLDSMQPEVLSPNSFAVVISDAEADAYAGSINESRRFFDTSRDELQQTFDELNGRQ
jgi:hypothetical protein